MASLMGGGFVMVRGANGAAYRVPVALLRRILAQQEESKDEEEEKEEEQP